MHSTALLMRRHFGETVGAKTTQKNIQKRKCQKKKLEKNAKKKN